MGNISLEEKIKRATAVICKQGMFPFPVNATTIAITKHVVGPVEDELDLICAFDQKASQTLEELKASSGLPGKEVERRADSLARKGLVFNQPSSTGVMVYRLLPLMNVGVLEYKFMGPLKGDEKEKELAELFERLMRDVRDQVQANYDTLVPVFQMTLPVDRTVPARTNDEGKTIRIIPLERKVGAPEEVVLPSQSVDEIIDKFEEIAVGRCFCRQRRKTLGHACATDAPVENCFTFGKSARFTSSQGFARMLTKEEARKIMREAEDAGLVHKAFHPNAIEARPETSICNCCKDCCDTLNTWREGALPLNNSTYYLSVIDQDACTGCGICESWCPTQAIRMNDEGKAERDEKACFGCGICARFCPEGAISLQEGLRRVFILPPRMRQ
jgi:Pyruvate/2-oxoacid:ferredoxin oxidoreductase delta subunit